MNDNILWNVEDNIGKIILNSPPSNPMNKLFFERLKHIVKNLIPDSGVSAIIVYGAGRHYSHGADLKDLLDIIKKDITLDFDGNIVKYPELILNNIEVFDSLYKLNIPVISAIKGVCIGSGLELALFSHIRISCEGSLLGLPETSFDLMPGCGGIVRFFERAGYAKTVELVLTGDLFSCEDALKYNIVDKILPRKNFMENVIEFAKKCSLNYNKNNIKECLKTLDYVDVI
jgi:enoyl-CoA hydratase/carnithine racemase